MYQLKSFIKPVFYGFMLFLFSNFFMPEMVLAQAGTNVSFQKTGPFAAFLTKAAKLFFQTRNALFVIAIFAFLTYAWNAIMSGSIKWDQIFYLIVGLTILGVAGFVVNYMAGDGIDIQQESSDLRNIEWTK